jgi:gas vesicle protein
MSEKLIACGIAALALAIGAAILYIRNNRTAGDKKTVKKSKEKVADVIDTIKKEAKKTAKKSKKKAADVIDTTKKEAKKTVKKSKEKVADVIEKED